MLDRSKQRTNLQALRSGQRGQMSIDVVRNLGIDTRKGEPRTGRKEHFGDRLYKGGFAAME